MIFFFKHNFYCCLLEERGCKKLKSLTFFVWLYRYRATTLELWTAQQIVFFIKRLVYNFHLKNSASEQNLPCQGDGYLLSDWDVFAVSALGKMKVTLISIIRNFCLPYHFPSAEIRKSPQFYGIYLWKVVSMENY